MSPALERLTAAQVADRMAAWATANAQPFTRDTLSDAIMLRFTHRSGKPSVVWFVESATEAACRAARECTGAESALALVCSRWPPERLDLEPDLPVYVWRDSLRSRTGANRASSLVDAWLGDEQVKTRPLPLTSRGGRPETAAEIVGREAVVSTFQALAQTPWWRLESHATLFCVKAAPGMGKSFLIEQLLGRCRPWAVFGISDHHVVESGPNDVFRVLADLARSLNASGCPTPGFDAHLHALRRTQRPHGAPPESPRASNLITVSNALKHAAPYAGRLHKVAPPALHLLSMGFEKFEAQQQQQLQDLMGSEPVRALTQAFARDLERFTRRERRGAHIARRVVLCFDNYELIGPVVDTWLRHLFLEMVSPIAPLIVIAGRLNLVEYSSRWTPYLPRTRSFTLAPFDVAQTTALLHIITPQIDADRAAEIHAWTHGVPLFIALVVGCETRDAAVSLMAKRILEETPPQWHRLFIALSRKETVSIDDLRARCGDGPQAEMAFAALAACTFVVVEADRLRWLPIVREVLERYADIIDPKGAA